MALAVGSAMTGGRTSALVMGASPPGVTVGTVGIGPVARDEVVVGPRPAAAPGVLAPKPTGLRSTRTASDLACYPVDLSPPSRSVEATTRLETRTKESNMYTSRWVD